MNFFMRFAIALCRTAADVASDVLPVIADRYVQKILPSPALRVRSRTLAGVRALTEVTEDGAVLRGMLPEAGAKFTLKNGLPEDSQRRLAIENEPHLVDGFNGEIKQGYGKGTKTLLYHGPVVVKIGGKSTVQTADYHLHQADKAGLHFDLAVTGVPSQRTALKPKPFEVHFCGGPLGGHRYAFVNTIMKEGDGGRMCVPMVDKGVRLAKPDYRLKSRDWLRTEVAANPGRYIIEVKKDGALANVHLEDGRAAFRSHREGGVTYYDRLPGLENVANQSRLLSCRFLFPRPDLNGTVLKGELYHDGGSAKTAGVLNSNPDRAIAWQKEHGNVDFYAWDIVHYKGRDVSAKPYEYRRQLLEQTVGDVRRFNRNWKVVERMDPGVDPVDFFDAMTVMGEEGIVVKDRTVNGVWYKVKRFDEYDLKLVRMVEGSGKYAGSVGTLVVRSPETGELGEIGSFAISDQERAWLWQNRKLLDGAYAKVRAMEMTEARGVPRAGVFTGMHQSKGSQAAVELLASRELT